MPSGMESPNNLPALLGVQQLHDHLYMYSRIIYHYTAPPIYFVTSRVRS